MVAVEYMLGVGPSIVAKQFSSRSAGFSIGAFLLGAATPAVGVTTPHPDTLNGPSLYASNSGEEGAALPIGVEAAGEAVSNHPPVASVRSQENAVRPVLADSPPPIVGGSLAATAPTPTIGQGQVRPIPISFAPAPTTDPDADPDKLLALYQDEVGQSGRSMDELDLVIGGRQVFSDLRTLQMRLNDMRRPTLSIVNRHSSQSDQLEINELQVSQDFFFSEGRDNLRLAVFKTDYSLPNALGINEYTGGFTSNFRLTDISTVAADLWVNRIDYGRQRSTLATYDVYLTLRPTDTIRIDIDANRRTFDNITSLRQGITARTYSGSIDIMPTDELRLTARVFAGLYSDRNRRRTEEVEAIWRVKSNPIIEVGLKGSNFEFSRLLNNGYFNPRDYYSGEVMARVQADLTPRFTVELAGSAGAEDADPGGVKPLIKGSLQVVYKITDRWSIEGEAAHFTSRDSTSSGFYRTSFTAGLHYRF